MGDVFIEQLIKKRSTSVDLIKQGLIILAGILIIMLLLPFFLTQFMPFVLVIAVGLVYLAYYLISGMQLEYEYIYTNGEIDVDKIIAKRKRKRITTVRVSSFDEFGPFQMEQYQNQKYDITINVATALQDPKNYYGIYRNREGKRCCMILTPNEKLLGELQQQYKRKTAFGRTDR